MLLIGKCNCLKIDLNAMGFYVNNNIYYIIIHDIIITSMDLQYIVRAKP